jgi:hypothetical protein
VIRLLSALSTFSIQHVGTNTEFLKCRFDTLLSAQRASVTSSDVGLLLERAFAETEHRFQALTLYAGNSISEAIATEINAWPLRATGDDRCNLSEITYITGSSHLYVTGR